MTLKRKIERLAHLLKAAMDAQLEIEADYDISICLWLDTVQIPRGLEEISGATGMLIREEIFYNSDTADVEVVEVEGIKFFKPIAT